MKILFKYLSSEQLCLQLKPSLNLNFSNNVIYSSSEVVSGENTLGVQVLWSSSDYLLNYVITLTVKVKTCVVDHILAYEFGGAIWTLSWDIIPYWQYCV